MSARVCTTAELIADAARNGSGVAAFNVVTLEHGKAIVAWRRASCSRRSSCRSARTLWLPRGRSSPHRGARACRCGGRAGLATPGPRRGGRTLGRGSYRGVFVGDGRRLGALPYAENVAETADAARWLPRRDVFVEGRAGTWAARTLRTVSAHAPGARTDPRRRPRNSSPTLGVDALAIAVGSFARDDIARTATLDFGLHRGAA